MPTRAARPRARAGVHRRGPALQELVSPPEDLPVADQRRAMTRVEPRREPVEEAAPRHRRPVEDLEILPSRRPPRAPTGSPRRCSARLRLQPLDRPPDRPRVPRRGAARRHRARSVPQNGISAKRTVRKERPVTRKAERFEEVGLALGVGPGEEVQLRRRTPAEGAIITEF